MIYAINQKSLFIAIFSMCFSGFSASAQAQSTLPYIELEQFGGAADNGTTDNTTAWINAMSAAMAQCKDVHLRKGVYYFSQGIAEDFSGNTSATACIPNIIGEGLMGTYLAFGNGSFNGLTINGSLQASDGYSLSGVTIIKGGYTGNKFGDGLGSGLVMNNVPRSEIRNVRTMQWNTGFYGLDQQEMVLYNFESEYNYFGMKATYSSKSSPNNITCINCKLGANFVNGGDIVNAAAFNWVGGSIESNSPQGHQNNSAFNSAEQWGLRLVYTNAPIEGASSATFTACYVENNMSPSYADIYYSNGVGPGALVLNGCTFQRHNNGSVNNVLFETFGGFPQSLVLTGNGFLPGSDYTPSSSQPYVKIKYVDQPIKIVDSGNVYSSSIEIPGFAATPVVSGCGTGATVSGNRYAGVVVEGAGASGCTLTFSQAFPNDPAGIVSSPDGIGLTYTITKTGVSILNNGSLATKKLYYIIKDVVN